MAVGAVVNACWDLAARRAGKPLWQLLADLSPDQIADLVDFRYLTDALTRDEALELLERGQAGRDGAGRRRSAGTGYPAYSTTPGWLGYSDDNLAMLSAQAVEDGFTQIKLKVGVRLEDDKRRFAIARQAVGDDSPDRHRRQPGLGRAHGHQLGTRAGPAAPGLDRGADEPLGHPRDGRHPGRAYGRSRWLPASTSANRVVFKQLLQAAPSTSCRSTPAGWRA